MAKYLVETYYTCSFKVSHYLDEINQTDLEDLEKRDDGKFEVIDVKLDNRKTKNLEKIEKKKVNIIKDNQFDKINNIKINDNLKNNEENLKVKIIDNIGKRLGMPDRRKGYIKKQRSEIIRFIFIQVNMKMERLVKFLLTLVKRVN